MDTRIAAETVRACNVFFKRKAVVLVGLLKPRLAACPGHACHMQPKAAFLRLARLHIQASEEMKANVLMEVHGTLQVQSILR